MNNISIILLNALPDKKIKSLGNRCLIKVSDNNYLIDYHITVFNKLFNNPEIIIVNATEGKRLQKYLKQNYKNIKYIEHNVDHMSNLGQSMACGLSISQNTNNLIINSSIVLNKTFPIQKIQNSSAMINTKRNGNIGCILSSNDNIINCYYGLNNELYDILYISDNHHNQFKTLISQYNIDKLYMFEIINLCIENNINIQYMDTKDKDLTIIDSSIKIQKMKNKLCV